MGYKKCLPNITKKILENIMSYLFSNTETRLFGEVQLNPTISNLQG